MLVGVMCGFKMVQLVQSQGMLFTTKHVTYQVKVCFRDLLVCFVQLVQSRDGIYNPTHDLSGQSTPHVSRSRATCHVIQSPTIPVLDAFLARL